jgi:hypothetical protein
MKKISSIFVFFFIFVLALKSQTVDSIKVEQAGELIKIHYKILNSNQYQTFKVAVSAKINGGLESKLESLIGDVGDAVKGGKDSYIVIWDVLKDVDEVNTVDFSVRAELVKDDTPITKSKNKAEWPKERFHTMFAFGQISDDVLFGIQLAYMGSWGITAKYLRRNIDMEDYSETTSLVHYTLGLTKRIINKDRFSMHLLAGMDRGHFYLDDTTNSIAVATTYELGTIMAYKRLAVSFALSGYKGNYFVNWGIGIRF